MNTALGGGSAATMRVTRHLDEDVWRSFVAEHPRGNVFHTPEMFRVFADAKGHRPELWAVVDEGSRVVALMTPVRVSLAGAPLRGLTTRSIVYGGALCRDTSRGVEALGLLLRSYALRADGSSLFTELRNLHDPTAHRATFDEAGFEYEEHLNYLISLDVPIDELLGRIRTKTRKAIRKGLRDGDVEVDELEDRGELDAWYRILESTYRRVGVPLADRSLFEAAFRILRPRGMVRFFLARVRGVPVACSAELAYKDTVFGWYGGSDRAYGRYLPNEMLMWHVLEWGARQGYRVYDFGGAGRPGEDYGVRDFKAKFGGRLVSFGRFTRVHAPHRLALAKAGYAVAGRLRRNGRARA